MYKSCVTEQSALRQREIEAGLLQAMKTHAYEDITVSELCLSMNVPRKSFYRYFSGKDGALYALIDHTLMDFSDIFFPVTITNSQQTLERFFAFWQQHDAFLSALDRNGLGGILMQRAIEKAKSEQILTQIMTPTYAGHSREYALTFLVSGLMSMVVQWHHKRFQESPKNMAVLALQLLTDPSFSSPLPC